MERAARGSLKYRTQKVAKNSPSAHHRTTLSGYIFANKAQIDNQKKMLNSNISPTCPYNMVNFGPLAAEINGFRVLAALLHGTLAAAKLCVVEQTAERPSRWALAHMILVFVLTSVCAQQSADVRT